MKAVVEKTAACSRCRRYHRRACGIPARVTLRETRGSPLDHSPGSDQESLLAGTMNTQRVLRRGQGIAPTRPAPKTSSGHRRDALEGLLAWGQDEQRKLTELLKALSPEFPEYNTYHEKLERVQAVILQLKKQIAERQ